MMRGTERWQEVLRGAEGYREVPRGTESCQKVRRGAEMYQEVPRGTKRCQEVVRGAKRYQQSCKYPGSRLALQQEIFEKIMNLRKFLRNKKRVFVAT